MKRLAAVALILMIGLTGCSEHFYHIEGDTLHLYLRQTEAKDVFFASSEDGYERHPAVKIDHNTWEITLSPATEFKYFYIVDGSVFLPACKFTERDDFGSEICIYDIDM